jgi:hypothetical protein
LQTIYDNGDRNAIVFSHGGAIMFWTMMNAKNLTMEQTLDLLRNYPLDNTDYVVIEGNAEDGWTVVNWNGQQISAEPTLGAELQLQLRTLQRQLAATAKRLSDAFATLNPAAVMAAIIRGVGDATFSIAKFVGAVNNKVLHEVDQLSGASQPAPSTDDMAALASTPAGPTANVLAARSMATHSATTEAVVGDTTPTAESATAPTKVAADPTPSEASKPEPVEQPEVPAQPVVTSNGRTDLNDGNKVVPGPTATPGGTTGDGAAVAVNTDVEASTPDAGDSESSEGEGAAA